MLAGELYDARDPELVAARARARELLGRFNAQPDRSLLEELLGSVGPEAVIEPPFHCDYGFNISVGERFYANVGCVFLDCAPISIGDDVWIGGGAIVLPGVTIGDRAVVGAGSVVTRDIAADAIVAGNPARAVRDLEVT